MKQLRNNFLILLFAASAGSLQAMEHLQENSTNEHQSDITNNDALHIAAKLAEADAMHFSESQPKNGRGTMSNSSLAGKEGLLSKPKKISKEPTGFQLQEMGADNSGIWERFPSEDEEAAQAETYATDNLNYDNYNHYTAQADLAGFNTKNVQLKKSTPITSAAKSNLFSNFFSPRTSKPIAIEKTSETISLAEPTKQSSPEITEPQLNNSKAAQLKLGKLLLQKTKPLQGASPLFDDKSNSEGLNLKKNPSDTTNNNLFLDAPTSTNILNNINNTIPKNASPSSRIAQFKAFFTGIADAIMSKFNFSKNVQMEAAQKRQNIVNEGTDELQTANNTTTGITPSIFQTTYNKMISRLKNLTDYLSKKEQKTSGIDSTSVTNPLHNQADEGTFAQLSPGEQSINLQTTTSDQLAQNQESNQVIDKSTQLQAPSQESDQTDLDSYITPLQKEQGRFNLATDNEGKLISQTINNPNDNSSISIKVDPNTQQDQQVRRNIAESNKVFQQFSKETQSELQAINERMQSRKKASDERKNNNDS